MLTAIYTSDIKGNVVVPFVDATREIILSMLAALPSGVKVYAPAWMKPLLDVEADVIAWFDEAPDWSALASGEQHNFAFFDEGMAASATSFYELLLSDDDVIDGGAARPNLDLKGLQYDSVAFQNGCRLQMWQKPDAALAYEHYEACDVLCGGDE
jgi:hypothetical protein